MGNIASWTRQADANPATQYVFGYDAADQILAATKQTTDPTPTILTRNRYAYDPAGNRTSEQIDDAVTGATYNGTNELVSTQPSGGVYFSGTVSEPSGVTIAGQPAVVGPDNTFSRTVPLSVGTNTIAITATDSSGNAATKSYQVTTIGSSTTFTYDANGNLTSDGMRTLTWDAENRLISVTVGTHTSTFTYDGLDRRVRIVEADNGATTSDTRFVWCALAICEARDSGGTTVLKRYFAQGVQDSGSAYFYSRDHLGSVRELSDGSGMVRARYEYDPWGRRSKLTGDKDSDAGFTGHYQHGPTGFVLTTYRAYDPTSGRWVSEDPLGLGGGPNPYAYVDGNPLGFVDPLGLTKKGLTLALVNGIAVTVGVGIVVSLLSPAEVAAITAIGALVAAYSLYQLYNSWGCLSGDQKDEVVGQLIGGIAVAVVGGAIVARVGPSAPRGLPTLQNLGRQLAFEEAAGAFTEAGELSEGALQGAREIIPAAKLDNPAIPEGFGKFATDTFQSPSGPFQVHFYMNPETGEVFYGLDYKTVFNNGIVPYTVGGR